MFVFVASEQKNMEEHEVSEADEADGTKKRFSINASEVSEVSDVIELEAIFEAKEQIFGAIGNFGKWQLIKCIFIVMIIWLPGSFHLLNMVFFR